MSAAVWPLALVLFAPHAQIHVVIAERAAGYIVAAALLDAPAGPQSPARIADPQGLLVYGSSCKEALKHGDALPARCALPTLRAVCITGAGTGDRRSVRKVQGIIEADTGAVRVFVDVDAARLQDGISFALPGARLEDARRDVQTELEAREAAGHPCYAVDFDRATKSVRVQGKAVEVPTLPPPPSTDTPVVQKAQEPAAQLDPCVEDNRVLAQQGEQVRQKQLERKQSGQGYTQSADELGVPLPDDVSLRVSVYTDGSGSEVFRANLSRGSGAVVVSPAGVVVEGDACAAASPKKQGKR